VLFYRLTTPKALRGMMVVWKIPWGWFRGTGLRGLWGMSAVKLGAHSCGVRQPAWLRFFGAIAGNSPAGPGSLCVAL
jgi:hypothetical protein